MAGSLWGAARNLNTAAASSRFDNRIEHGYPVLLIAAGQREKSTVGHRIGEMLELCALCTDLWKRDQLRLSMREQLVPIDATKFHLPCGEVFHIADFGPAL